MSPEMQLFARMKLQRVVFGAFAIVLVCLFALGLSAYRRMQQQTREAQAAEQDADMTAKQARARADQLERELQVTRGRIAESEHSVALSNCRLAMHEIRAGQVARARALLDEAKELGPPAWWPLVAQLTQEATVRFEGSDLADQPIVTGAISGDLSVVAVVRRVGSGVVVETWGARDGKRRSVSALQEASETGSVEPAHLRLNEDGSAWYLAIPFVRFHELNGSVARNQFPTNDLSPSGTEPDVVSDIAADPELKVIYEAMGPAGLARRTLESSGKWSMERVPLDLDNPEVQAVCLAGQKPIFATPRGIYSLSHSGNTGLLYPLDRRPDRVALKYGAGAVYAALLNGRSLTLMALKPGESPHVASSSHEMPDEPVEDLRFLADDTLVWVGRSGRMLTVNFGGRREWTLGGYTLSFVERHPGGLVFANRKGELSLRSREEFTLEGVPVHLVPPQFVPEATAHGFLLQAPNAGLFAVQQGRVRDLEGALSAALAPQGAAYRDGGLVLPDGVRSGEDGALLAAFADGSVLLFAHKQKLKRVSSLGIAEFMLPGDRAPDAIVVAARASVAAMRVRDTVYVADMERDPAPVASRLVVAPDVLALDAAGAVLAIAYGSMVVVHSLRDGAEQTVRAAGAPKRLALLFEGSVLVSVEGGELVFYEVATGRELTRAGTGVTDAAASGDDSLNLVSGGWLRTLSIGQPR